LREAKVGYPIGMPALAIVAFAGLSVAAGDVDLAKYVYPLRPGLPTPPVTIDVSDAPETKAWAEAAKAIVEQWYPRVTSLLATEDYRAPKEIRLIVKKEISAPAWASSGDITINGKWITEHPDDLGMVVHELTHVVQGYSWDKTPGWLTEGIADYIRWWRYEPEAPRPRIDPAKSKYTDAYRTTAYFLAWTSKKYDMRLVPSLDLAIRKETDPMPEFKRLTGKTADELWTEFVAAVGNR
jgi:hypothetical protein